MRPARVPSVVAAASALALACAHAPAAPRAANDRRVVVTGSHVPQRLVGNECLPATAFPLVVYPAEPFARSGMPVDMVVALSRSNFGVPCGSPVAQEERPGEE